MKFWANLLVVVVGIILFSTAAFSGELDPGTGPGSTTGYTLNDIWNRLNSGADGVPYSAFLEPAVDPTGTVGIVKTLYDIMMAAPKKDDLKGADPEDVLSGKTYWGLTGANWGKQTGTLPQVGQQNIACGSSYQVIAKGYHDGTGTVVGDADLTPNNIKGGINIFGVDGKAEVVDTSTTTPAATIDIRAGKTAFVNGAPINGALPTRTLSGTSATVDAGYYDTTTLDAVDSDLSTVNIKSGVSIFGVPGKMEVVDTATLTPATAVDIRTGKTAFANGATVSGSLATRTLSNASTTVDAGYYDATALDAVEGNLVAANVKDGVDIFGVVGTYPLSGIQKTGQTGCWDEAGASISCAGTGQDGDLQRGVAWPSPRFTDNSNGTVTDNLTGLIWLKNANCTETAGGIDKNVNNPTSQYPGELTWANALTWSNNLSSGKCGLSDGSMIGQWRLPNRNELASLVDAGKFSPALPSGHPFQNVQSSYYWSGSTHVSYPSYAWNVFMNVGYVYNAYKTVTYYVWPVRGGQ